MTPYWSDHQITLHHGRCEDVLPLLDSESVDAVVTDPPYNLAFMGREWDRIDRYQEWCERWAAECLRILKPGGHLTAFGGTRTYHRLASGIEDAGFEIRDCLEWLYSSGFPKGIDVSKAIDAHILHGQSGTRDLKQVNAERPGEGRVRPSTVNNGIKGASRGAKTTRDEPATTEGARWAGWNTALKPAHEMIALARKPLAGTVAVNTLDEGTGALNIAGCRVGTEGGRRRSPDDYGMTHRSPPNTVYGKGLDCGDSAPLVPGLGRWPPNVLLGEDAAAEIDRQSGTSTSKQAPREKIMQRQDNTVYGKGLGSITPDNTYTDSGGASRFYPVFRYQAKAPPSERPEADGEKHYTVKPVPLMQWLVRLVTPPGGVVLDLFAGTGTTAEACIIEGFRCILVEKDELSARMIMERLRKPIQPALF